MQASTNGKKARSIKDGLVSFVFERGLMWPTMHRMMRDTIKTNYKHVEHLYCTKVALLNELSFRSKLSELPVLEVRRCAEPYRLLAMSVATVIKWLDTPGLDFF